MSALDSLHRALTQAYGTGVVIGDETAEDLLTAAGTEFQMDAQAYPGELDMLRGLIATLHVVTAHGDLTDVAKVLAEHKADDTQARAETSSHERRLRQLLAAIRLHRGAWTSKRTQEWRRFTGGPTQRGTASHDLTELTRRGHLQQHGPTDGRFYTLNTHRGTS